MSPKRVGFLIYPAMQALDLVGPMDAFSAVTLADAKGRRRPGYEVLTIDGVIAKDIVRVTECFLRDATFVANLAGRLAIVGQDRVRFRPALA